MPLPILNVAPTTGPADLVRLFHKLEAEFAAGVGETEVLDAGTACFSPTLPGVFDANRLFDAALPPGASAAAMVKQVDAFYASRGVACRGWVPNPSTPAAGADALAAALAALGFRRRSWDVLHLARSPRGADVAPAGLSIVPSRAAYAHARALATEATAARGNPQLAEAQVRHLDDPRYDEVIALRDGRPVARAGVLAVGELGLVEQVYVAEPARRQGVGTATLSRALDACRRAQLRHVLLRANADDAAANALYARFGFARVGEFVEYASPAGDR